MIWHAPRQARLDAPGVLQHIMIRGIERRKIGIDNKDREDMLERLANRLLMQAGETYTVVGVGPS